MPSPTIPGLFGANATVMTTSASVTASSSDPVLVLKFSDFASTGWNTPAGATNAEKWLAAIILKARAFYASNADEVPNVAIGAPFLGLSNRNSLIKREYNYSVAIYETDTGAAAPDPDNV
jgi:hypothetical protein